MTAPKSQRDLFLALLLAVGAHVIVFFIFVVLTFAGWLSASEIEEDEPSKPDEQLKITMVYDEAEEGINLASPVEEEETTPAPEPEPEPVPVVEEEEKPEPTPPPPPGAFAQTDESQATEKPEDAQFIGENNTIASSDAGAVAGDQPLTALAGEEEMRNDPKTRNSDFSKGENSGAQGKSAGQGDPGQGQDQHSEEGEMAQADPSDSPDPVERSNTPPLPKEEVIAREEREESPPKRKSDELAEIDKALRQLEEAIAEDKSELKKEETMPERKNPTTRKESAPTGGDFEPQARKTKVRGVISRDGKGSVSVEDTPAGRYEAKIYKALEQHWQMENYQNRSLIAPGNITLYFRVDQKGKVTNQKRVSMNGASRTQWGMVLRALNKTTIPKMPREVIQDLDGEPLELTVTFNY